MVYFMAIYYTYVLLSFCSIEMPILASSINRVCLTAATALPWTAWTAPILRNGTARIPSSNSPNSIRVWLLRTTPTGVLAWTTGTENLRVPTVANLPTVSSKNNLSTKKSKEPAVAWNVCTLPCSAVNAQSCNKFVSYSHFFSFFFYSVINH